MPTGSAYVTKLLYTFKSDNEDASSFSRELGVWDASSFHSRIMGMVTVDEVLWRVTAKETPEGVWVLELSTDKASDEQADTADVFVQDGLGRAGVPNKGISRARFGMTPLPE